MPSSDSSADRLAHRFEGARTHLHRVARHIIGDSHAADDVLQDAWLKVQRADLTAVDNLDGWFTTVTARTALDHLRRRNRRAELLTSISLPGFGGPDLADPADDAVLVDEIGRAMLVVLGRLTPPERVALVLHDVFALPFEDVAVVLDRTTSAAKKLASRARHKVGPPHTNEPEERRTRVRLARRFLAAAREGDVGALVELLHPDVVRRGDVTALHPDAEAVLRGRAEVLREIAVLGRRAAAADVLLVDGEVGAAVTRRGRLTLTLTFRFRGHQIAAYDVVSDPAALRAHRLSGLAPLPSVVPRTRSAEPRK